MVYVDNHLLWKETFFLFEVASVVLAFGQWKACHMLKKFGSFFSGRLGLNNEYLVSST